MDPNEPLNPPEPARQQPESGVSPPTPQPAPTQLPPRNDDPITAYSIVTLIASILFAFIGMIMAIVGLFKAKKSGSNVNKAVAIVSLVLSLVIQVILIGAFIAAWNSDSFQQRKAQQAAQNQQTDDFYEKYQQETDVNQEEYDQIQNGMSLEEVETTMGHTYISCEGDGVDTSTGLVKDAAAGTMVCKWGPGIGLEKNIAVTFTNNAVASKEKTGF